MKKIFISLCIIFLFVSTGYSQQSDSTFLTINKIFKSNEFTVKTPVLLKWSNDNKSYTVVKPSKSIEDAHDIVRYDILTNNRSTVVSAEKLIPPGETKPLFIDDYFFSKDHKKLLIYTNSKRIWRRKTRGDYWVLNLESWKLLKLGSKDAKPSTLKFAKFSPDSKNVAYVRENNIYVENIANGKITPLTKDGSVNIINGTFDWVYEEELDLRDGFRWSPDSKSIAYWQLNQSEVPIFYLINNTDSLYPFLKPILYPTVGQTNSIGRVGVVSAEGGKTEWMKIPGDPQNHYIARMDWAGNSDQIYVEQLNRVQDTMKVMLCNVKTGNTKNIYTDTDSAWVDVNNDLHWFDNGKYFTWTSDKDGWHHIYIISRDGKNIKMITPGNFDVVNIEKVNAEGGYIYYEASPKNPTQRYLFRVNINGEPKEEKITPDNFVGTNSYNISPDAKYAFHTFSTFNTPPTVSLISLPDHKTIRMIENNTELKERLATLKKKPTRFFTIDIGDGIKLSGWEMLPYNFNPSEKYPVLFYVYGEPAAQSVLDIWNYSLYLWHLMLTQHGYIVISVDNRGTPAPRGRKWRKALFHKIGILNQADQAAAARKIIDWPYVDTTRIGVWGWSGGGSMTLNLMFRHPDIYKIGMSVAPVPVQWLYDDIYQERYMGLWNKDKENYIKGSPITYAKNLEGNLLLIHGTGDDNVHFAGSERLINELIKDNKLFSLMIYPNRTHSINEGKNTRRHLFETLTHYLENNLPAGVK